MRVNPVRNCASYGPYYDRKMIKNMWNSVAKNGSSVDEMFTLEIVRLFV